MMPVVVEYEKVISKSSRYELTESRKARFENINDANGWIVQVRGLDHEKILKNFKVKS